MGQEFARFLRRAIQFTYRSYHNAILVSRDRHIDAPTGSQRIRGQFDRFDVLHRLKQSRSQPRGVRPLGAKRIAKHPRFVTAARVRRVETIVLNLADIEDRSVAIR